jgi:transposase
MPHERPKSGLVVTTAERETLEGWAQAPSTSQALAERARMVLACAEGDSNASVAVALGVTPQTVGKWRERFVGKRSRGLADAPRSGAPPRIPTGDVEWVLTLTLLASPRSSRRWSARSLSEICGMSPSSVSRIWRGFGLRSGSLRTAHRRSQARVLATFDSLAGLYLDPRHRGRVWVHRMRSSHGLRAWLAARDAAVREESRAELILCECGSACQRQTNDWQAANPHFGVHIAPRGPLWCETLTRWFAMEADANALAGMARIQENVRRAIVSGDGFGGGTGSYAWSAAGERIIRAAAGLR